MTLIQTFHGNATNGTELTAVYAEQPAANVAFALVFPGNDLPRLVHWGRPLAAPATVIDMFDAQIATACFWRTRLHLMAERAAHAIRILDRRNPL